MVHPDNTDGHKTKAMTKEQTIPGHLLDRRFTLVTGKGGVGKTTVTALLARRAARNGHRTLVCELNSQDQFSQLMGVPAIGPEIEEIEKNLWAVNINPDHALLEYGLMKLRYRALYQMVFNHPLVRALVKLVPGMNELLMLGKAFNHEREQKNDGRPVWDRIIIDAPASGHGVSLFRLPKVIKDAVPRGNMHDETADMWSLLSDSQRTVIHIVSLPEALPSQETQELWRQLKGDMALPMGALFINRMPTTPLSENMKTQLRQHPTDSSAYKDLMKRIRMRDERIERARRYEKIHENVHMPSVILPEIYSTEFGCAALDSLAMAAFGQEPGDE